MKAPRLALYVAVLLSAVHPATGGLPGAGSALARAWGLRADPRPRARVAALRGGEGNHQLKIALCAWESLFSVAVGGVAPHVTELARGLSRLGHEAHLYVRMGSTNQKYYEIIDGVHVHRVPIELDSDFVKECSNMCNGFMWFIGESEAYMQAKFDIIHAHDWLTAKVITQAKQLGRRTVFTIHSTEYGRCGNAHYGGQSARIRGIEQEACDDAHRTITLSGRLAEEVRDLYNVDSEKRLCKIYNGIHAEAFGFADVDAAVVKREHNIPEDAKLVLCVGRLTTAKGPDILMDAVPVIVKGRPEVVVAFVGDGHMHDGLEASARRLNVQDSVRFLGSVSGDPLKRLFAASDCVCVPSRNEPFGIVVLEAWACGKPVVVSHCGGPGEFVRNGIDGIHVQAEPGSVAWGVLEIFADEDKARTMGRAGRERCYGEFSWDSIVEKTAAVYYEIL